MESTELRTTLSIHVCASPPGHDSLIAMPNQRVAWHQREALQIAIKLRLGWSEALRCKNRTAAAAQPLASNWFLIACYENFFQQRTTKWAVTNNRW